MSLTAILAYILNVSKYHRKGSNFPETICFLNIEKYNLN